MTSQEHWDDTLLAEVTLKCLFMLDINIKKFTKRKKRQKKPCGGWLFTMYYNSGVFFILRRLLKSDLAAFHFPLTYTASA